MYFNKVRSALSLLLAYYGAWCSFPLVTWMLCAEWVRAKDKTLNLTIRTPVGSLIKAKQSDVRGTRWDASHPFPFARFKFQKKEEERRRGRGLTRVLLKVGGLKCAPRWEQAWKKGNVKQRASLWCSPRFLHSRKISSMDSREPRMGTKCNKLATWQELWMHTLFAEHCPGLVPLRRTLFFFRIIFYTAAS